MGGFSGSGYKVLVIKEPPLDTKKLQTSRPRMFFRNLPELTRNFTFTFYHFLLFTTFTFTLSQVSLGVLQKLAYAHGNLCLSLSTTFTFTLSQVSLGMLQKLAQSKAALPLVKEAEGIHR